MGDVDMSRGCGSVLSYDGTGVTGVCYIPLLPEADVVIKPNGAMLSFIQPLTGNAGLFGSWAKITHV